MDDALHLHVNQKSVYDDMIQGLYTQIQGLFKYFKKDSPMVFKDKFMKNNDLDLDPIYRLKFYFRNARLRYLRNKY